MYAGLIWLTLVGSFGILDARELEEHPGMGEHVGLGLKPVQVFLQLVVLEDVRLHLVELQAFAEIDVRTVEFVDRSDVKVLFRGRHH